MSELDDIGPGSLKVVVTSGRSIERALLAHVPQHHLRPAGDGAWVVFTEAEPAAIRDWLSPALDADRTVFVVEFERWSGQGDIDRDWLLRRGH
jgi:hypothetical protein